MVCAREEGSWVVLAGLLRSELVGARFACGNIGTGAGGLVFRVIDSIQVMRFAGMPLAPAGGFDVSVHYAVQVHD